MRYSLVHRTRGKRIDFGSKSELIDWIKQHGFLLSDHVQRFWSLYRLRKTSDFFSSYVLSDRICSLFEYINLHKLLVK